MVTLFGMEQKQLKKTFSISAVVKKYKRGKNIQNGELILFFQKKNIQICIFLLKNVKKLEDGI